MDIHEWLWISSQFLVAFPGAASCYLAAADRMKFSVRKTTALCCGVLVPYCLCAPFVVHAFSIPSYIVTLFFLPIFFSLYRRTVDLDLPRALAIYVGVCAIETFPAQFAYAFDAWLHPQSGAARFSIEGVMFQLLLSCLLLVGFIYPAIRYFSKVVDRIDFPQLWYYTVAISAVFFALNMVITPQSYATVLVRRMTWLYPLLEGGALVVLIAVYALFYRGTLLILENEEANQRARIFEMQAHQYKTLREHMHQTAVLRHDFRHSLGVIASLASNGDLEGLRTYIGEYEIQLGERPNVTYCRNAALNALFGYYHEMAVAAHIQTDWRIELPEPLTISELDLTSLFGNLLENAVDACRTVPEDSRYCDLTVTIRHASTLYIVCTNSFDGKVHKTKDGYRSTKHAGSGIGLAAMRAVVHKYHGSINLSNSTDAFFADITLQLA